MTDRTVPAGYERPHRPSSTLNAFYLTTQTGWTGATPLFMVMHLGPGVERILAERCLVHHGKLIVDALRFMLDQELLKL